jgi:hypothetical protein
VRGHLAEPRLGLDVLHDLSSRAESLPPAGDCADPRSSARVDRAILHEPWSACQKQKMQKIQSTAETPATPMRICRRNREGATGDGEAAGHRASPVERSVNLSESVVSRFDRCGGSCPVRSDRGGAGRTRKRPLVVWQSRSAQSHISLLNSIRLNHSEPDRMPSTTSSAPKVLGTTFDEPASWPPKPSSRVIPEPVLGQLRREFSARRRA